jgi:hypothetical protein
MNVTTRRALSIAVWTCAALVLFGAVATLRAHLDGEREIAASDAAFDANDLRGAIEHARRAASAYVPGAPHVEQGYARLQAVARGAEATGRPEVAMLAYQAQRAAALESASFVQPFPGRLEDANRNLARLAAAKTAAEGEHTQLARRLFKDAQAAGGVRSRWGALLAGGLFVAAGGLAAFASRALGAGGRIDWLRGRWGILAFALGAALWAAAAFHG